jgi:DNA polymerase
VYLTNAVKHFSYTQRGERRIHAKPTARQVAACRPWVENEIEQVRPMVLLCMGATAAQSLIGPSFRITRSRGEILQTKWCEKTLATWHPSAILRVPDDAAREQMRAQMIEDLRRARKLLAV